MNSYAASFKEHASFEDAFMYLFFYEISLLYVSSYYYTIYVSPYYYTGGHLIPSVHTPISLLYVSSYYYIRAPYHYYYFFFFVI